MLASQSQHHHVSAVLHLQSHRSFTPPTTALHASPTYYTRQIVFRVSSSRHHRALPDQDNDVNSTKSTENNILRTHNAKSTALLLHHLSSQDEKNPDAEDQETYLPLLKQDKEKLLEISLLSKRTPQFPGSIYANPSSPLVQSVLKGQNSNLEYHADEVDDEMLLKALEIRRKVTAQIIKQAMKKGKFGITYCENLVSKLPEFIDHVMIKAVKMKELAEFSQSSYNVRAEIYIHECGVVPLIRWLKHNSLSYPQIGKLICASKGNLDSIKRLAEWLKTIHVKGRYIGVALTRAGGDVLERSTDELDEIVDYLEENGVRRDWLGYVVSRCPEVLSFTMEELRSRAEFYLRMGMDKNDFGTMLFDCPRCLVTYPWKR